MKNEQQADRLQPSFKNVKEIEAKPRTRMEKALSDLQHEMAAIRTGRASIEPSRQLRVDYYGTPTPLNQVAKLHVPEPAHDHHSAVGCLADRPDRESHPHSDLGLNPSNDGKLIRLPIPPLTEERRKDLVKKLHDVAEDHRVALRNIRRDATSREEAAEGQDDHRRRRTPRARRDPEADRRPTSRSSTTSPKAKEKEILELK